MKLNRRKLGIIFGILFFFGYPISLLLLMHYSSIEQPKPKIIETECPGDYSKLCYYEYNNCKCVLNPTELNEGKQ